MTAAESMTIAFDQGKAAIEELLDKGIIDGERIEASLERICTLKEKIKGELSWKSVKPTVQP